MRVERKRGRGEDERAGEEVGGFGQTNLFEDTFKTKAKQVSLRDRGHAL